MRNKGKSQHRFKQNPLEEMYATAWEEINTDRYGHNTTLDYMLAEDNNRPCGEVTDRDRVVASTVIQWLGSPVGQNFVKDVLEAWDDVKDSEWVEKRHGRL